MAQAPQDQIAPLLTPEGWELLASLGPYREDHSFELNATLRKAGHSPALVAAVLQLIRACGLEAVWEGVETAEQADILRDLGCLSAQGYFFSRPLPPEKIPDFLAAQEESANP